MKFKNLQPLDQNIITIMKAHIGLDKVIKLDVLVDLTNSDRRTIQARIAYLQEHYCAIGSTDDGYFVPQSEEERTAGITKKEKSAYSALRAISGVRTAPLDWLDKMMD
ncbi:hypothetical protein [Lactococcus allomyrinae]|uniref:Uncharacterized protein n=1 Tax=Lactococcus allomyrinae TaxID=2419773 RepID=A0A387BGQ7_9LACT|nr:hypothetical protein [Lactococcus allomyrinae]AYG01454.1 hypothetical protein D7I46_10475 [Lactococcus allomyrinae]